LRYFTPELALIAAVLLLIVWDLAVTNTKTKLMGLVAISMAALAISGGMSAWLLSREELEPKNLFYGLLAFDRFSNMFRILFAAVTATIVIFSIPAIPEGHTLPDRGVRDDKRDQGEFFTLLMVLTLGMNLMAESRSLLMIYLSLEIVS